MPQKAFGYQVIYHGHTQHFVFTCIFRLYVIIFYPDLRRILLNRMGEHTVRIRKVEGSIPFESSKRNDRFIESVVFLLRSCTFKCIKDAPSGSSLKTRRQRPLIVVLKLTSVSLASSREPSDHFDAYIDGFNTL